MSAAGAGLTCAFAFKREAWGSSLSSKVAPCTLGISAALATGTLRLSADRHWLTDVAAGFLIGGFVGYFDTWGPLDFLKQEKRDRSGRLISRSVLLPTTIEGRAGFQFSLVF